MERQQQALAGWLEANPQYALQDQLVDAGVSAGKGKHRTQGALSKFIAAGKTGAIPKGSCLVVESVSRFSREASTDALMSLLGDVLQPGLAIAFTGYASGKIISADTWNREPGLKYGLIAALDSARTEWEERSARSRGGARKRERLQNDGEKIAAATPWWIQRDPETKRVVRDANGNFTINPVAKATIERAIELAISGMGTTLIAATLNEEKRPLPQTAGRRNQYTDKAGETWSHGRVSYLLRHPALLGDLTRRDGTTVAGFYPPLLSVERWHELRASMEARDKLRGSLRGGGQKVNNIFMGLSRCAGCGGPLSFHDSSERARIDHPGYMACRGANRRANPTCNNSGYLNYSHVEAHCLTRLMAPIWADLLGSSDQQQEASTLQERVNTLAHELRGLDAQLTRAEERLQVLWISEASDVKQELAEKAVTQLRQRVAALQTEHEKTNTELQLLLSKPTGAEAAAQLQAQVQEFWQLLRAGELDPAERRAFNRWLRTRIPAIEFRITVEPAQVELVVGGESAGIDPLAPIARSAALDDGIINPAYVEEGSDGWFHIAQDEPTPEQEINGFTYAWLNEKWVVLIPDDAMPPPLTPEQAELLRSLEPGS